MQNVFAKSRITLLDVLRGYALMGLFLIHMVEYFELYWYDPEPGWVNTLMFGLFGGKAYAIFALLFGVSFFIIMDNQARKGLDFRARFAWRITLLLGMGYLHGLIYGGDILQILAVAGLLLIPLYGLGNTALLLIALAFALQVPSLLVYVLANTAPGFDYARPLHWTLQPAVFEVYAQGGFAEVLQTNAWRGQIAKWAFMIESGRLWNVFGLAILGFLLGRVGFFVDTERFKTVYLKVLAGAVALAIVLSLLDEPVSVLASGTQSGWILGNIFTAWTNHAFIAISVVLLMLLYRLAATARVLQWLAPCGRMTLTFYVAQSVVFVPFFYGYGAGAFEYIGQPLSLWLGLVLWGAQMWLARYWIERYHYGPLEWCWRAATWLRTDIAFRRIPAQAN